MTTLAMPVDVRIANVAAHQLGTIASSQLLHDAHVSRGAVRRRLQSGALVELLPGVYGVGPVGLAPTDEARRAAAVLFVGPDGALGVESAAERLRIWDRGPRLIHVITPRHEHGRPVPWLQIHRSRTLVAQDIISLDGIATTNAQRTCLDLGFQLRPVQINHVIHEAVFRGILDVDELEAELDDRGAVPGTGVVRDALARYRSGSPGTRSGSEDRLHGRVERDGLPLPIVNTPGAAGVDAIECDMVWPKHRLVVEIDGGRVHDRPDSRIRDAGRSELIRAAGMRELRIPAWRCWNDLDAVMRELAALLSTR